MNFFQVVAVSILLYGGTTWMLTKQREKARWEVHKNTSWCLEQILESTPYKTAAAWPPPTHLTIHPRNFSFFGISENFLFKKLFFFSITK